MIPRTKANYSISDIFRALFIDRANDEQRELLTDNIRQLFGYSQIHLTGSGRASLYFILKSLPHKRVVVPAYTCKAVVEAISLSGKKIIHVDVNEDDFNICISELSKIQLDNNTVVLATHQFGIPCEIETIQSLCRNAGAYLIEDVAAAFGSRKNGRLMGTFGDIAFFSFDSTKLINVPLKAGFIGTNNSRVSKEIGKAISLDTYEMSAMRKLSLLAQGAALVLLENHYLYRAFHYLKFQSKDKYTAEEPGINQELTFFYKERLAEWQAFIINFQFANLDKIIKKRQQIYQSYSRNLTGRNLKLPPEDTKAEWACIRFPIRTMKNKLEFYRDGNSKGIDFAFSFTFIECPKHMKAANRIAESLLDIPFYFKLSPVELNKSINVLNRLDNED